MEALLLKGFREMMLVDDVLTKARGGRISAYLESCGWGDLHLWLLFSLLYSSDRSGQDLCKEQGLLKDLTRRSVSAVET